MKIVDVTSKFDKRHQGDALLDQTPGDPQPVVSITSPHSTIYQEGFGESPAPLGEENNSQFSQWHSESPSFDTPNSVTASFPDDNSFRAEDEQYGHESPRSASHIYPRQSSHDRVYSETTQYDTSPHGPTPDPASTNTRTRPEDAAADLLALRYLQHSKTPSTMPQVLMPPPGDRDVLPDVGQAEMLDHGIFADQQDGIFLPGSVFQEFHSTLRDHLIYTARSNCPTRVGTPELQVPDQPVNERLASRGEGTEIDPESNASSRALEITPQREYVLWKAWINELAPWLDKFDNNRHFEHKIPMMARKTPHLRNSVLALSARQIEMKENSKSSSESLALYQEAIHLLLPELQSKGTAVIASCVILCVLEMMSCSPKEWRRHLEGCANLLEAVGINGFVGGVEEALFWCFARMDLCGALISQDTTLIPVTRWASNFDFSSDVKLFRNPVNGFDTYANYAVFLCANCVAYLKDCNAWARESRRSRWIELVDLLEDWHLDRPEEMKPILTISLQEGDVHRPFPTVLYGNGPAVSGNQLYHTAMLLMLQERPSNIQLSRKLKSTFWHARQICAISESNTHHGAWTNSIQPIWIAGKVMSHPSEHKAILNILERIERETGWVTSWRREDLKAWWGDCDD
ncbi:fungal-specific transcription factor domain-containing protein [Cadophora sp. MPI-SDFR-AT-0126]|nr:fungal-specific transcription factor domain-containing protein [Leotiomycetes sp. MPI-SDFR-AT-0126]